MLHPVHTRDSKSSYCTGAQELRDCKAERGCRLSPYNCTEQVGGPFWQVWRSWHGGVLHALDRTDKQTYGRQQAYEEEQAYNDSSNHVSDLAGARMGSVRSFPPALSFIYDDSCSSSCDPHHWGIDIGP